MYFGHTSSLFCSRSASHTRLCRLKGSARPRNGRIFNYWLLVCSVPVAGRNMIAYPGKRLKKNNSVTEQAGYHNTIKNLKQQADNLKTKTNKQKIPFNLWGRLTAMKRFFLHDGFIYKYSSASLKYFITRNTNLFITVMSELLSEGWGSFYYCRSPPPRQGLLLSSLGKRGGCSRL